MKIACGMGRVDAVLASAGTGKTTFLVRQVASAIAERTEPERIVATTFTRKAAAELEGRIRNHLVMTGDRGGAVRLLGAQIGTVHAVCGRIVQDFAMELGLAPGAETIEEDAARALFRSAAAGPIARHAASLDALAEAFGLSEQRVD